MFPFWSSGDVCLGSKAREDHLLACLSPTCSGLLRFTSRLQLPVGLLVARMTGQSLFPFTFFMQFQTLSARSQSDTYPTELPTRQGLPIFQEFLYAPLLFRYFEYSINSDPTPYLKDIKSSSLANVMILLESSFGTGNKYFSMLFTCSKSKETNG